MPFAPKPHQFLKMLRAALAHGVREGGRAVEREGYVLYFHETLARLSFQAKIQPRPLTCDDFTTDVVVAFQFLNGAAHDGFGHEAIRMHRVNAHPSLADSNDFPGVSRRRPSLSLREIYTTLPGSLQPIMLPVFVQ